MIILHICTFSHWPIFFARALGFEPRSRVLETRMLAVAPCPQKETSLNPSTRNFKGFNILKIYFKIYSKTEAISLLKNKVPKLFA